MRLSWRVIPGAGKQWSLEHNSLSLRRDQLAVAAAEGRCSSANAAFENQLEVMELSGL